MKFSDMDLYTMRSALRDQAKKWGEPIATDYYAPALAVINEEIEKRELKKARIDSELAKIAEMYDNRTGGAK